MQSEDPHVNVTEYPKFKNDRGLREIQIGVKEFKCIGVAPPNDHPHVFLNMGKADSIICPYCATRFRHNAELGSGAIPADSVFEEEAFGGSNAPR